MFFFVCPSLCFFFLFFSFEPFCLRKKARNGVYKYTGMWQSLVLVAKEEGRRGLYAGMGTHVVRVVRASARHLALYILIFGRCASPGVYLISSS